MSTPPLPSSTASITDVLRIELDALKALEKVIQFIRAGRMNRSGTTPAGPPVIPAGAKKRYREAVKALETVLLNGPMSASVEPPWHARLCEATEEGAQAFEWLLVLTKRALRLLGVHWPKPPFNPWRLKGRQNRTFPKALPENAIAALFSSQLWVLLEASQQLSRRAPLDGAVMQRDFLETAELVCEAMADVEVTAGTVFAEIRTRLDTFDPLDDSVMWTSDRVRMELGATDNAEVENWANERNLIAVPTKWDERLYPSFQFSSASRESGLDKLHPNISALLKGLGAVKTSSSGSPPMTGWPLALWAHANLNRSDPGFFEKELSPIGLWSESVSKSAAAETVKGAIDRKALPLRQMPHVVYRVGDVSHLSPYHFSTESGRYDLTDAPGVGTMYVGRTALGCWAEVLDREPVVTLDMLSRKRLWVITVALPERLKILDLTQFGDRLINAPRQDSQDIANYVQAEKYDGVEYSLRSMVSQTGIALFGPTNARGLIKAGRAVARPERTPILENEQWITEGMDCLSDADLWDHLISRRPPGNRAALLVLRNFPSFPKRP